MRLCAPDATQQRWKRWRSATGVIATCPYGGSIVTTHDAGIASASAARHSRSRSDKALATLGLAASLDATLGWIFTLNDDVRITQTGDLLNVAAQRHHRRMRALERELFDQLRYLRPLEPALQRAVRQRLFQRRADEARERSGLVRR